MLTLDRRLLPVLAVLSSLCILTGLYVSQDHSVPGCVPQSLPHADGTARSALA